MKFTPSSSTNLHGKSDAPMSLKIYVSAGPPIGYLRFTRFVSGIGPTWSTTILRSWKCSKELETILKFHIILFCFFAFLMALIVWLWLWAPSVVLSGAWAHLSVFLSLLLYKSRSILFIMRVKTRSQYLCGFAP